MRYRPEIDGLRAVAVIPVILFHAGLPMLRGGFVGVDVFFVISGFLIARILAEEVSQGDFSFLRFYERRARRILPALFVVLLSSMIAGWLILTPAEMEMFSKSAGAVALFVSNLFLMRNSGYFAVSAEFLPLLHTWSLAVEEQFYIVMPFVMLALPRLGLRRFTVLLGILAAASFALSLALLHRGMTGQAFYLMPTRAWELLAGALAALVPGAGRKNGVLAGLGLAAIAGAMLGFSKMTPTPSWPTLLPVLGAVLVMRHATRETVVGRVLALRPLVWVGLLSYSAYLWHQPVFAYARIVLGHIPLAGMLGLSMVSLGLAWATWRLVETPTRRGVWWPWGSTLRVLNTSGAGLAIVLVFAMVGWRTEGFAAQRVATGRLDLLESARPSLLRGRCHATNGADSVARACAIGGETASWAVLGDSHGVELSYALAQGLQPKGIGVREYTFSACGPKLAAAFPSDACVDWHRAAVRAIAQDPEITTVVVIYRLNMHLLGNDTESAAPPDAADATLWASYLEEVRLLRDAGKTVVAVLPVPELPRPVDQILFRAGPTDAAPAGVERAWWQARNGFVQKNKADLGASSLIVDPTEAFCTGAACLAAIDSEVLYFDSNHPSVAGAGRIADMIFARLSIQATRQPDLVVAVKGGGAL